MNTIVETGWGGDNGIGRYSVEIVARLRAEYSREFDFVNSSPLSISFLFSNLPNNKQYYYTPGYALPFRQRKKAIITIHDLMHLYFTEYRNLKSVLYYKFLVKPAVVNAPVVFTVSEYSKKQIVKWSGVKEGKVVVTGNGVDPIFFNESNNYQHVKPYVLYVGNYKEHKNIYGLLKSFSLSNTCKSHDLLMLGECPLSVSSLIEEFGLTGKVVFVGRVSDLELATMYKGASVTLLLSYYEGFGLPIIESMACGTNVITSNVTSMPEIAGGRAYLCDPNSYSEISAMLDDIALNGIGYSSIELKNHAKKYTWDNVFQRVYSTLKGIGI
ncbi:MAG: glycosyltransferase family 1 protein [Colwellia sp.]